MESWEFGVRSWEKQKTAGCSTRSPPLFHYSKLLTPNSQLLTFHSLRRRTLPQNMRHHPAPILFREQQIVDAPPCHELRARCLIEHLEYRYILRRIRGRAVAACLHAVVERHEAGEGHLRADVRRVALRVAVSA